MDAAALDREPASRLQAFRGLYRREYIGRHYSGRLHLGFTVCSCLAAIFFCAEKLHGVGPAEWLTIPFTFFFANVAEHMGHRGPMHHRKKILGLIFDRHAGQHHCFFSPENMAIDSVRDYKAVLFPPILLLFFFGAFALPVGIPLAWIASTNTGWLFAITSIAYFLNYELLHFAYHAPGDSWISRLPGLATLRRHHALHHNPALMSHYNFNITYPISDHLFGTHLLPPDHRVAIDNQINADK